MITREQVIEALQGIEEPTLGKKLVEENLVRDVMVKDGTIRMTIALYQLNEDLQASLEDKVKEAISAVIAEQQVHIRFREMTPLERQNVVGEESDTPLQTHGDGLESSLLEEQSGVQYIAIASGKGGVGKSTVTVNLATALARQGKRVGIMDADIYGFSVPDMMGIEERPEVVGDMVIPIERFGVKVISMGFFVEENAPVVWRGPMLGKMLRNFFAEVQWGEIDYMLLDLPPGTGDIAMDVHQIIPQSKEIIVTTPHATASFVAARAGAMAIHTEHEILGVVENMAYYSCHACGEKDYVFGRGGGGRLAEELRTDLLAQIPIGLPDAEPADPDFSPSVYKTDSPIGILYNDLAEQIIKKTEGAKT